MTNFDGVWLLGLGDEEEEGGRLVISGDHVTSDHPANPGGSISYSGGTATIRLDAEGADARITATAIAGTDDALSATYTVHYPDAEPMSWPCSLVRITADTPQT